LLPLFDSDVTFVCLQKEVRAEDQELLAEKSNFLHFDADFLDTAALTSLMDVVISVDTAGAHLAGAMGKPLWLLLSFSADWRWLIHRQDSPWYPTAKLFRQPALGDWDSVVQCVKKAIGRLHRGRSVTNNKRRTKRHRAPVRSSSASRR
jgi:ADP-heptose:LPS heptosyltransferase